MLQQKYEVEDSEKIEIVEMIKGNLVALGVLIDE